MSQTAKEKRATREAAKKERKREAGIRRTLRGIRKKQQSDREERRRLDEQLRTAVMYDDSGPICSCRYRVIDSEEKEYNRDAPFHDTEEVPRENPRPRQMTLVELIREVIATDPAFAPHRDIISVIYRGIYF